MKTTLEPGWQTAGGRSGSGRRFSWSALLWWLIFPQRRQRTLPTVSGGLLIGLALGIGSAAYNAGNNILFITLSLLLACLVLSGVLAWLNFRGMAWRLEVAAPLRAGQTAAATLRLRNDKRFLPSYGLWLDVVARVVDSAEVAKAETTLTARSVEVKAALARAAEGERGRVFLETRLDPAGQARLEWAFRPARRGRMRIELESIGSLFPFGFLKKGIAGGQSSEVVVWPAPVEYRRFGVASARRPAGGERVARVGTGSDLLALRRYELGDSHRLIHWKASARSRRLLVRQFAAESVEGFSVWVPMDRVWSGEEQFELLVALAATLAEDLFRAGKLLGVSVGVEQPRPVRRVRDLEAFLDRLAVLPRWSESAEPAGAAEPENVEGARLEERAWKRSVVTFAPDGPRGVVALLEGQRLAAV